MYFILVVSPSARASTLYTGEQCLVRISLFNADGPRAQTRSVAEEHEEHDKLMASVQSALDSLLGGNKEGCNEEADRAALLDRLKVDLAQFGKDLLEHLDQEELYFATPVARKVCRVGRTAVLPFRKGHGVENGRGRSSYRWRLARSYAATSVSTRTISTT